MLTPKFILGGKSVFTLRRKSDGQSYKFRCRHQPASHGYAEKFFFEVGQGSCAWNYVGVVNPETGYVQRTARTTYADKYEIDGEKSADGHPVYKRNPLVVGRWLLDHVWHAKPLPDDYECTHNPNCARCGRKLKIEPELGFGPECIKKVNEEWKDRVSLWDKTGIPASVHKEETADLGLSLREKPETPAVASVSPKPAPTPASLVPGDANELPLGNYKGKTYRVAFIGDTRYGKRAHLKFLDSDNGFWVDADRVVLEATTGDEDQLVGVTLPPLAAVDEDFPF